MESTMQTPTTSASDSIDIVAAARSNTAFRRVVRTGEHEQVVVMAIPPGGEIGDEVHPDTDQVFLFVEGLAEARIDGRTSEVRADELTFVHAGSRHNILNRGGSVLRLITVYAPPAHAPDTIHETKADADRAEH
jgi:mannose-6-phosphate isomerase-like protein (cupin superfamily)